MVAFAVRDMLTLQPLSLQRGEQWGAVIWFHPKNDERYVPQVIRSKGVAVRSMTAMRYLGCDDVGSQNSTLYLATISARILGRVSAMALRMPRACSWAWALCSRATWRRWRRAFSTAASL